MNVQAALSNLTFDNIMILFKHDGNAWQKLQVNRDQCDSV